MPCRFLRDSCPRSGQIGCVEYISKTPDIASTEVATREPECLRAVFMPLRCDNVARAAVDVPDAASREASPLRPLLLLDPADAVLTRPGICEKAPWKIAMLPAND